MGLTNEHVGPKTLAKIKIYVLTRTELLITLCYEIPCIFVAFLQIWTLQKNEVIVKSRAVDQSTIQFWNFLVIKCILIAISDWLNLLKEITNEGYCYYFFFINFTSLLFKLSKRRLWSPTIIVIRTTNCEPLFFLLVTIWHFTKFCA